MSQNPSTLWYWNDWDNDRGLWLCSLAAQGLWMRMLSVAARAAGCVSINGRGCTSEEIASMCGKPIGEVEPLISELETRGVFSRLSNGTIFSRRMKKDLRRREINRKNGKKGGAVTREKIKGKPSRLGEKRGDQGGDRQGGDSGPLHPIPYTHKDSSLRSESDSPSPSPKICFDDFWKSYPRREDKGHAKKAWERAIKKIDAEEIVRGAERYAAGRLGEDRRYTALPATWLNGERWSDEQSPGLGEVDGFGAVGFA